MSTILFENEDLIIIYYEDKDYLFIKWNGLIEGGSFKKLASEVLKAVDKTGASLILSDNTKWKAINPNAHGWPASIWFATAEAKGVKRVATVLSDGYFNRSSVKSIEEMAEVECLSIRNFTNSKDALTWLLDSRNRSCGS